MLSAEAGFDLILGDAKKETERGSRPTDPRNSPRYYLKSHSVGFYESAMTRSNAANYFSVFPRIVRGILASARRERGKGTPHGGLRRAGERGKGTIESETV